MQEVVIVWRWAFSGTQRKSDANFSSKQAALDDMCSQCGIERAYAENFVYSLMIPKPENWK